MIFMVVKLPWINIMSINPPHKYKTTKQVYNFNLQLYKRKKVTLLATNNNILHFIRVDCSIHITGGKRTCFYLDLSHWGKELNTTYLLANGKYSCSLTELFFTAEHSVKYKRTEIILLSKSYPFCSIWGSRKRSVIHLSEKLPSEVSCPVDIWMEMFIWNTETATDIDWSTVMKQMKGTDAENPSKVQSCSHIMAGLCTSSF